MASHSSHCTAISVQALLVQSCTLLVNAVCILNDQRVLDRCAPLALLLHEECTPCTSHFKAHDALCAPKAAAALSMQSQHAGHAQPDVLQLCPCAVAGRNWRTAAWAQVVCHKVLAQCRIPCCAMNAFHSGGTSRACSKHCLPSSFAQCQQSQCMQMAGAWATCSLVQAPRRQSMASCRPSCCAASCAVRPGMLCALPGSVCTGAACPQDCLLACRVLKHHNAPRA